MYYYYPQSMMRMSWILIAFAVIPAVYLMVKVYRSDKMEKESPQLMLRIAIAGILATALARFEERIGEAILDMFVSEYSEMYSFILYFVIVAFAEETSKYFLMKRVTWNSAEFNCQYDGMVYAVIASLGFALWENVHYVLNYGLSTAIIRAVTAIPGHASFGVFMGVFYGAAKLYDRKHLPKASKLFRYLAVGSAAILHGAYDYIATKGGISQMFLIFIAIMFIAALRIVKKSSKTDRYF